MVSGHLQTKKGYYYCVLSYNDENGKRKTKWISTGLPEKGNKKRAEAILAKERLEFVVPKKAGSDDLLFSDFLKNHWLPSAKNNIEATTYASYSGMVNNPIAPHFKEKGITLRGLTPRDIQDFYNAQGMRVKANTVKHYHAVIHKALEQAVKLGIIPFNPSDRVDRPRVAQFIHDYYNAGELKKLLEVTKDEDIGLFIMFAAFYGLRKSEILGLKWSAIDFENNTLTIKHVVTSANLDGKRQLIQKDRTKQRASYRTMPLVDDFKELLLRLKEAQEKNKELCKSSYDTRYEEYIFVDSLGTIFNPNYITRRFNALLKKNGLRKIRFHDLRHSSASLLAQNGIHMKQIQEWLGHSDFATTANIYSHLQSDTKVQVAESVKDLLDIGKGEKIQDKSYDNKEATSKDVASISSDI